MTTTRGQVVDPQGQPVAGASVYIISAPVSMPDIAQLTDHEGQFIVSMPVAGKYTVGASSDRWGSAQADIQVTGEESMTVTLKFTESKL